MEKIADLLRAPAGAVDLGAIDTRSTPGFDGKKSDARNAQPALAERIATLQEQLYAEGRTGGSRSVLLILQGMDTSGKGGTVKHVVGQVDPGGVHVVAFRRPTKEELAHDFLWRIRKQLPGPGMLAVFDRSQYEDVVAVRVRNLAPRRIWSRRYATINRFEERLAAAGTVIVKCFLHISPEEQRERLLARLDDPTKYWKYRPGDLEDRALWDDFQPAYGDAIERCSSAAAPWYVVPPTASGTATGRSAGCCASGSSSWASGGPLRRSTSTSRKRCWGRDPPSSARAPRSGRDLAPLREPDVVAGRVAERRVDPVRPLLGLLDELDAAALELLVGSAAVVGRQEDRPGGALRRQALDLLGGLRLEHRRARDRHQHDRDVRLPRRPDAEPAEVAHLGDGDVAAHLHAELLRIEVERLVLVVDPQLGVGDLEHRWPPGEWGWSPQARSARQRCLLQTCGVAGARRRASRTPGPARSGRPAGTSGGRPSATRRRCA